MEQKSIDQLKQLMITTYERYGNEKALLIKGERSYTGYEISKEIREETEFGLEVFELLIKLTLDLLKRNKLAINNEKTERQIAIEDCKNELLKQVTLVIGQNGYPFEAVPKSTILSLQKLVSINEKL